MLFVMMLVLRTGSAGEHLNLGLPHNLTVHSSWATRRTLENGDLVHPFWAEWEAKQGWKRHGTLMF